MKTTAKKMKSVLKSLSKVTEKHVTTLVKIEGNTIEAVNGSDTLTISIPGDAVEGALIELKDLQNAVKSLATTPKTEIVISSGGVISNNATSITLATKKVESWPATRELKNAETVDYLNGNLTSAIDYCEPAISRDETRYHLNGLYFTGNRVASTDGHRLHTYRLVRGPKQEAIVPLRAIKTLQTLDTASVFVDFASQYVRVHGNDYVYTARLVDAQFPSIDRVIPKKEDQTSGFSVDSKVFATKIESVLPLVLKNAPTIVLTPNRIDVLGPLLKKDVPRETTATIDLATHDVPRADWRIGINAIYLHDALSQIANATTVINGYDDLDPITIADGPRLAVIMPTQL